MLMRILQCAINNGEVSLLTIGSFLLLEHKYIRPKPRGLISINKDIFLPYIDEKPLAIWHEEKPSLHLARNAWLLFIDIDATRLTREAMR